MVNRPYLALRRAISCTRVTIRITPVAPMDAPGNPGPVDINFVFNIIGFEAHQFDIRQGLRRKRFLHFNQSISLILSPAFLNALFTAIGTGG